MKKLIAFLCLLCMGITIHAQEVEEDLDFVPVPIVKIPANDYIEIWKLDSIAFSYIDSEHPNYQKAAEYLEEAIHFLGEDTPNEILYPLLCARHLDYLKTVYCLAGDFEKAYRSCFHMLKIRERQYGDDYVLLSQTSDYYSMGNISRWMGKSDQAIGWYKKALSDEDENGSVGLAIAYLEKGDSVRATQMTAKIISRTDNVYEKVDCLILQAYLALKQGDDLKAISLLKDAIMIQDVKDDVLSVKIEQIKKKSVSRSLLQWEKDCLRKYSSDPEAILMLSNLMFVSEKEYLLWDYEPSLVDLVETIIVVEEEDNDEVEVVSGPVATGPVSPEDPVIMEDTNDGEVYELVENQPHFPGDKGDGKVMMEWLGNNIRYPQQAKANGIYGTAFVQFIVWKDGRISDPKIVKSSNDKSLDAEALRVVKAMPKWIPGHQYGKPVNVRFTLPVRFKL